MCVKRKALKIKEIVYIRSDGHARTDQLHKSFYNKNLSFISLRQARNSQFIEKHDSISRFCF